MLMPLHFNFLTHKENVQIKTSVGANCRVPDYGVTLLLRSCTLQLEFLERFSILQE